MVKLENRKFQLTSCCQQLNRGSYYLRCSFYIKKRFFPAGFLSVCVEKQHCSSLGLLYNNSTSFFDTFLGPFKSFEYCHF
ncbi:hypothetical protein Gasu2_14870 [Galdieria sulphuraria]|nr:hypothetical protein Gasu2_14870 [Galdieria sulphuraria]